VSRIFLSPNPKNAKKAYEMGFEKGNLDTEANEEHK